MAHLRINSIDIEGFMSIGQARVELNERGVVLVRGVNQFESKSSSNGSGKSAIFESVIWALTGSTSRGSSTVVNRFTCTGTKVVIDYYLDTDQYVVIRTDKHETLKTSLTIYKNGEDISGNTATKSKSILKDELTSLTYDLLTSIVILSQGLPGRLSSLKPSQRKSRLEELSSMDSYVAELDEKASKISKDLNSRFMNLNSRLSVLDGKLEATISTRESTLAEINKIKSITPNLMSKSEYEQSKGLLESISVERSNCMALGTECTAKLITLNQSKSGVLSSISRIKESVSTSSQQLDRLLSRGICPTCNSHITKIEVVEQLQTDLNNLVTESYKELASLASQLSQLDDSIIELQQVITDAQSKLAELQLQESTISSKVAEYDKYSVAWEVLETTVVDSDTQIRELNKELATTRQQLSNLQLDLDKVGYIKKSISRKFRTFLLEGVVNYMNHKCEEYSKVIFSNNGVVSLELDKNNINIKLGDQYFEELSGGESRRVDIILQIVQRDLAKNEAGISSNILILDEILDYLDSDGVDSVISLIESKSSDVGTIMIVTHKSDITLPYDEILTVIKDKDRVSRIEMR